MSSEALYQSIYEKYINALTHGSVRVDNILARHESDDRRGISLIIPMHQIGDRYRQFIRIPADIEPDLYLYPLEDLHITIFDFIQGNAAYRKNPSNEMLFKEIAMEIGAAIEPFPIRFKGIVFSDEAGMLQGYDDDRLVDIRRRIRAILERRGVKNDERYESQSAHITFCRFQKNLKNADEFLRFMHAYRSFDLGTETVDRWELVEHDWYNMKIKKTIIADMHLGTEKAHDH